MNSDLATRLDAAAATTRSALLAARGGKVHWAGELSSSALSTATAVCALALASRHGTADSPEISRAIDRGLEWLAANRQPDGGWGDTPLSESNISTTTLVWAAFGAVGGADEKHPVAVNGSRQWLKRRAGDISPACLASTIVERYGRDRTFSVPILTMCALSGRLGSGREAWQQVLPLPFELAAIPHQFLGVLRLPVVSYALPALIAIGQARHHCAPSKNPVLRLLRGATRNRTLKVLQSVQPSSGGFLEAIPLTSFVVMSLIGGGQPTHPVTKKGVEFLLASGRPDGSWPIDTNLATWVTTLAVKALGCGASLPMAADERRLLREWLLAQQHSTKHPYTHAPPGGWAWTDLPGGVPDSDDTAGALLALRALGELDEPARRAGLTGVEWLLGIQNSDGGIPTFCRGWTKLPFDRSSPDLTAHALRAWVAWKRDLPEAVQRRIEVAIPRALRYLARHQGPDGEWIPLWFGNQHALGEANPVYGTARVAFATAEMGLREYPAVGAMLFRAVGCLRRAQGEDGGWGGSQGVPASVEETSLAVSALAAVARSPGMPPLITVPCRKALKKGVEWLVRKVEDSTWTQPAPIGFYFAKLWYYERLYPMIFTAGALGCASSIDMHRTEGNSGSS